MSPTEFGEYLALQRKRKGYTQKQLAEILFVTDKAISRWECGLGFPDIRMLQPISQALGVSLVELLNAQPLDEPAATTAAIGAVQSALTISQNEIVSVRFKVWRNILVFFLLGAIFFNLYHGQVLGWLIFGDQTSYEYPYMILYYLRRWIAAAVLLCFGLSCYLSKRTFLVPLSLWGCVCSTMCTVIAMICWSIINSNGMIGNADYVSFVLFPLATVLEIVAATRYRTSRPFWIQLLLLLSAIFVFISILISDLNYTYANVLNSVLSSLSLASPMLLLAVFLRVPSMRHFGQTDRS